MESTRLDLDSVENLEQNSFIHFQWWDKIPPQNAT